MKNKTNTKRQNKRQAKEQHVPTARKSWVAHTAAGALLPIHTNQPQAKPKPKVVGIYAPNSQRRWIGWRLHSLESLQNTQGRHQPQENHAVLLQPKENGWATVVSVQAYCNRSNRGRRTNSFCEANANSKSNEISSEHTNARHHGLTALLSIFEGRFTSSGPMKRGSPNSDPQIIGPDI